MRIGVTHFNAFVMDVEAGGRRRTQTGPAVWRKQRA